MSYLVSLIRRYPLITFFALAYALSWWPWILYALDLSPQPIVGLPFLAAPVVLAITRGKTGVVGLLRRMVRGESGYDGTQWPSCSLWRSALPQQCSMFCWAPRLPRRSN